MSYVTQLRTCTYKSILGFGDDDQKVLTVYELLGLNKHYELVRAYYCLGKITFMDDVLNEIGITEDMRIEKPGKDWDAWRQNWKKAKANVIEQDATYEGMNRIQESLIILNRLYPKEYLECKPRRKQYEVYDEKSKAKSLAYSKKSVEEINDHYVASLMAQDSTLTYKELRQQPELLDAYRQNIKIKRLIKTKQDD